MFDFKKEYLVKGVTYALILSAGTLFGMILRLAGFKWTIILSLVAIINTIAAILVFKFIKKDLVPKEEKNNIENEKSEKSSSKDQEKKK